MGRGLVTVAVVLVLVGLGLYSLRSDDSGSANSPVRSSSSIVSPLTSDHGMPEYMPQSMRRRVAKNLEGLNDLPLRLNRAQYVRTRGGIGLWIVEGPHVSCLVRDKLASVACRRSAKARRLGIWLGTYKVNRAHPRRPEHFLALGVVPSGIKAVGVKIVGSKRELTAPTVHGVWAVGAKTPIHFQRLIR